MSEEKKLNSKAAVHKAFSIGIFLKGVNGFLETVGGGLLFIIKPAAINRFILLWTQGELAEDPQDIIAHYLVNFARNFSLNAQIFSAIYLLSHGAIKIFLVVALFKRKLWAYPSAIFFFFLFILYQIYRFSYDHSLWLVLLTVFDIIIIVLTYLEYRELKREEGRSNSSV